MSLKSQQIIIAILMPAISRTAFVNIQTNTNRSFFTNVVFSNQHLGKFELNFVILRQIVVVLNFRAKFLKKNRAKLQN